MEGAIAKRDALRKLLIHVDHNTLVIESPGDGTVTKLHVQSEGAYVHEGDPLVTIAPEGADLYAKQTIPEDGIGRIGVGNDVKLLFDAFPYQRFGVKTGSVEWVSPGSVIEGEKLVFRGRARIVDRSFVVHGKQVALVPGLTGTAKVIVGRRALIGFAFEPIQQLRENLM